MEMELLENEDSIKRTRSYVEEAFKNILRNKDVVDILVLNAAGNPVKTSMGEQNSLMHAGMFGELMQKARYVVQQIDPDDDIISIKTRSKHHETLIFPDDKLTFIVIQDSKDKFQLYK